MALVNCARCGKVFSPEKPVPFCPDCVKAENEDYKKVAEYLRDYPLANVMEVANRTGVSPVMIFKFVRAGSLRLTDAPAAFKCRMCGKEVKKGTLCQDCIDKVKDLKEAAKKKAKKKR
ncbi:MAG: MerR family transcriptional regulator [Spirochaetia bacterium]|nr:MerR family transcriptional regulator [Spirochaetia bacterium]